MTNSFKPTWLLRSGHLNTIFTNRFRKIESVHYTRQRVKTWDNDFIDFDYSKIGSKKVVLIFHGLEGSSDRQYARGMVRVFNENGYDGVVMNHRSCSGEPNKLPSAYHSGKTDDVHFGIKTIAADYDEIVLVGFSLGGNMLLKYLGDGEYQISEKVKKAIGISVPVHLKDSAEQLAKRSNLIYMKRFLKTLKIKTLQKIKDFPELQITAEKVLECNSFVDFDNLYTAPVHGFKNAEDYWLKCSSLPFLKNINIPTLLINAINDPFLGDRCYPREIADASEWFSLKTPKYGGHVGFGSSFKWKEHLITEREAVLF